MENGHLGFPAMKAGLLLAAVALPLIGRAASSHGFRVPDGFEVSVFAGDDLAHDIFSMTTDREGRIVVASRGWIKTLHDTDNDGVADRAVVFAKFPQSGAQGMYFDDQGLIVSGDRGVRRWPDRDGDGRADGEPELLFATADGGEHGAHGIVKGPDGWLYLMAGNFAGIGAEHAQLPGSPVKQVVAGAVVRFSPDGQGSEVVAHGFRNPYDLDFHPAGHLLTYESDGERDDHLPWYSGSRLFDIAMGAEHGWILKATNHAWNRPEAWFDNTARIVTVGRGSPSGLVVYRHRAFPERYRNGVFMACWTFGRIYFCPLIPEGATFRTRLETFMTPEDNAGFAPVDLVVGPDGDLFVAIGGRGTRGTVYRVKASGSPPPTAYTGLRRILAADQPLSSWSRRQWVPQAQTLGPAPFEAAAIDRALPLEERIRAIEIMVELFGGLRGEVADSLVAGGEPAIAARVAWALRTGTESPNSYRRLAALTRHDAPQTARAGWEALLASPFPAAASTAEAPDRPDWYRGLDSPDRRVRGATVLTARGPGFASFAHTAPPQTLSVRARLGVLKIYGATRSDAPGWIEHYVETCLEAVAGPGSPETKLDALRLLQLALGDLRIDDPATRSYDGFTAMNPEGVPPAIRSRMASLLAPLFPMGEAECDRELIRMLALLRAEASDLPERIAGKFSLHSRVEDDLFYLMAALHLDGVRAGLATAAYARALALLFHKMRSDGKAPSRYWSMHVGDMAARLLARDRALNRALMENAKFNLPDHALFGRLLPADQQGEAARALLTRMGSSAEMGIGWTSELVAFLASLPDSELFPVLRKAWEMPSMRDLLVPVLSRNPQVDDRSRYVVALDSFQPAVVEQAARSLKTLPGPGSADELSAALRALRSQCRLPQQTTTRAALRELLEHWTGEKPIITEGPDLLKSHAPWFDFFRKHDPASQTLAESDDAWGWSGWLDRLAHIDWKSGQSERGRGIFEMRLCSRCHGSNPLGPDLKGVAARLGREDLFAAIVDPDRDISPAWEGKKIVTHDGSTHVGVVIYESPGALLLQTGADSTLRLTGSQIASIQPSRISLMPPGLLEGLNDRDLADFYAYLLTLK